MKKTVIGIGFVGLPLAAAFAEMGNEVWCLDTNSKKIEDLKKGILPIDEAGLESMVKKGMDHNLLHFTTDYDEALRNAEIVFIAVGTPPGDDGSADLRYVESVAREIGKRMPKRDEPLIVADKSTVPVGTADRVKEIIQEELDKRGEKIEFHVISNPEFMAEGRAVKDMMEPSRVVVGTDSDWVEEKMRLLYKPFMMGTDRFLRTEVREAELIKYASNTMLACKISYANTIAGICDSIGGNVTQVKDGMGRDPRIGHEFLFPSLGYGGSCFPKDVKALIKFAEKKNIPEPYLELLKSIEGVNNYQKTVIPRKIIARFGEDLSGKKFALWGLAFKAGTNDMRESAAINVVDELVKKGAEVIAYDPLAVEEAREVYLAGREGVSYEEHDKYAILDGCSALIIATETKEYRSPDFKQLKKRLIEPVIFDGRNLFDLSVMKSEGIEYYAIGRGDSIEWQGIEI